jgi:hypothetical protein
LVGTNITGTASGLTAGNVTTNANLTGAVTSVGNATSLGSFSSANLLGALTDETGTGSAVFATSPTLVTPILGTPTSATLTNATGLPIATGVSGLGTGIATALAVNTGSSGAPVINGGVLGTPSSGTVTNLTGTASININGTVGATTASTGAFTTLTTSSTVTHNGGTANGVTYLNGSKVLTSGSALTFDGTNLSNSGNYIGTASVGRLTKSNTTGRNLLTGGVTGGITDGAYIITEGYDYGGTAAGGAINLVTAGATSPISFFINGTEGMRLTSTGLGIGTSSPKEKIDSRGAAVFSGDNATGTNAFGTAEGILLSTGSGVARVTAISNGANNVNLALRSLSNGGGVDAITLTPSGAVALSGAVTNAGGVGITFPTSQFASSNANTLDDYEEGTWTMTLAFSGGNTGITYDYNTGAYTKVGRLVTVTGLCSISNKGSSTGVAVLGGLPFFPISGTTGYSTASLVTSGISYTGVLGFYTVGAGQDTMLVLQTNSSGVQSSVTNTAFSTASSFSICLSYFTA